MNGREFRGRSRAAGRLETPQNTSASRGKVTRRCNTAPTCRHFYETSEDAQGKDARPKCLALRAR